MLATRKPRWNWYFQSPWIDFKVLQGEKVACSLFHSHPKELMWRSWTLKRQGVTQVLWLMLNVNCGHEAQCLAECWFPAYSEGPQSTPRDGRVHICIFGGSTEKGVTLKRWERSLGSASLRVHWFWQPTPKCKLEPPSLRAQMSRTRAVSQQAGLRAVEQDKPLLSH